MVTVVHVAPSANEYCKYKTLRLCQEKDAEALAEKYKDGFIAADLIIIDDSFNQKGDFEGYKLLRLLRLHQVHAHCILYSFLPDAYYLRNDLNKSILLSEGVTFVRMPQIIDDDFIKPLIEKKSPDDLSEFFLHDYKDAFNDKRHFHANWWGPLRIMEYLKRADNIKDEDVIYANDSQSKKYKHSYKGLVLRYMKSLREDSVWESHIPEIQKKNKELKSDYSGLGKIIQKAGNLHDTDETVNQVIELSKGRQEDIEKKIVSNNEEIKYLSAKKEQGIFRKKGIIEKLRYDLKTKKPKILYIDDMAESGWSYVLKKLIYGAENPDKFTVESKFASVTDYGTEAERIVNRAKSKDYDIVIMDLRLKDEKGDVEPAELSGIKLLKALRDKKSYLPCPILVFSASNKSDVVAEAFRSGADAFWRKEGIDENNSQDAKERVEYTYEKIRELLNAIDRLCSEEYHFLYHDMLAFCLLIGDEKRKFWWEDAKNLFDKDENYVPLTKQGVAEWVWLSYEQLKDSLVKGDDSKSPVVYGQICMHLHKVLEAIHSHNRDKDIFNSDKSKDKKNQNSDTNGLYSKYSKDWIEAIGSNLLLTKFEDLNDCSFFKSFSISNRIRNNQTHNIGLLNIGFKEIRNYFFNYKCYLTTDTKEVWEQIENAMVSSASQSNATKKQHEPLQAKETNQARKTQTLGISSPIETIQKPTTAKVQEQVQHTSCLSETVLEPIKEETEFEAIQEIATTKDQKQEPLPYQDCKTENRLKGKVSIKGEQKRIVQDGFYYVIDKQCKNYDSIGQDNMVSFRLKALPHFTISQVTNTSSHSFSATITRFDPSHSTVQLIDLKADCEKLNLKIIRTNVRQDEETHEVAPSFGDNGYSVFLNDDKTPYINQDYAKHLWKASYTNQERKVTLSSLAHPETLWCNIGPKDLAFVQNLNNETIYFELTGGVVFYAIDVKVEK